MLKISPLPRYLYVLSNLCYIAKDKIYRVLMQTSLYVDLYFIEKEIKEAIKWCAQNTIRLKVALTTRYKRYWEWQNAFKDFMAQPCRFTSTASGNKIRCKLCFILNSCELETLKWISHIFSTIDYLCYETEL